MITVFKELHQRENTLNIHALKSITLEGDTNGIATFEGYCGIYTTPYSNLRFGGGIDHYTMIIADPTDTKKVLECAIFVSTGTVCYVNTSVTPSNWFNTRRRELGI